MYFRRNFYWNAGGGEGVLKFHMSLISLYQILYPSREINIKLLSYHIRSSKFCILLDAATTILRLFIITLTVFQ